MKTRCLTRHLALGTFTVLAALGVPAVAQDDAATAGHQPGQSAYHWYKGNTHTHTLWSDGDGAPELVADWYVSRGYDFLVLSDHNILSKGEKWFPVDDKVDKRLTLQRVIALKARFGADNVVTRPRDGDPSRLEMRLKTLDELKEQFEKPGQFIFIQGEEITDSFNRRPIHINAANIEELIAPQHGQSVRETMQNNINAVIAHGIAIHRPILAHINHPNFGWGLSVDDVASVKGERFFEVYNGHPAVHNEGDADHPSMEQLWDTALTQRLRDTGLGLLYGIATDDAHNYFQLQTGRASPGRGWVMVRATSLSPDAIITSLRHGDFYASSGVNLVSIGRHDDRAIAFTIDAQDGVTYTTRFIGTRHDGPVGEILYETADLAPRYNLKGDEYYVRAIVISSRLHPNPYKKGDPQQAWIQPVMGNAAQIMP